MSRRLWGCDPTEPVYTVVEQSCLRSMITETQEDYGLVDNPYNLSLGWPLNSTIEGVPQNLNLFPYESMNLKLHTVTISSGQSCTVSVNGDI